MDARREHISSLIRELFLLPEQYSRDTFDPITDYLLARDSKFGEITDYIVKHYDVPELTPEVLKQGREYHKGNSWGAGLYTQAKQDLEGALARVCEYDDNWYPVFVVSVALAIDNKAPRRGVEQSCGRDFSISVIPGFCQMHEKFGYMMVSLLDQSLDSK